MAAKKKNDEKKSNERRYQNRKAWHDYAILESLECGIELTGTEIKSIREGNARIEDSFARIRGQQVFLIGMNVAHWPHAKGELQHEPMRDRRLLLHRRQIAKLESHVNQKGKTLVPLALYFVRGWAKVELGLAVGKRTFDKRDSIKKREHQRDIDRAMSKKHRK